MKWRWKLGLGFAALGVLAVLLFWFSDDGVQRAVEDTRRTLRDAGFKTDLAEFDFSASPEQLRGSRLLNSPTQPPRSPALGDQPDLMLSMGADTAMVAWQQDALTTRTGEDTWPLLRESLQADRATLDAVRDAALAGPIRFHLVASQGNAMLLPHLAPLKRYALSLARRAVFELRDDRRDATWSDLLAATRLVTAWNPEPAEVSHMVRWACAEIAFNATWQVLQAEVWSDDQLARLQQEWEAVDFFKGLPEVEAFSRASWVATCRAERQQPISRPSLAFTDLLRSPRSAWYVLSDYAHRMRYRHHGSYQDERALLLHYRDRELALRRAIECPTWSAMRAVPGATNPAPFASAHHSTWQDMMRTRQIMLQTQSFRGGTRTLPVGAAQAEVRRRLILAAIALERCRVRHGSFPEDLTDLAPEFVTKTPTDFIDGQPLRYRRSDDGHFVLHSIGLDGVDDGGVMPRPTRPSGQGEAGLRQFGGTGYAGVDIVWPRPASPADVAAYARRQQEIAEARMRQAEIARESEVKREEADRRATVERLVARPPVRRVKEPMHQGRPLTVVLRNPATAGDAKPTLDELLTLRQVSSGHEPDVIAFEVPVAFAALTNLGELRLLVDTDPEQSPDRERGAVQECLPATNGNCLLTWNTFHDPPGRHALQAQLSCSDESIEIAGPVMPFYSSNAFYFDEPTMQFGARGAVLSARLAGSNATYTIEVNSPAGEHLKSFSGTTTNGVIRVRWDLIDDQGRKYTNESFESRFHVTLPDAEPTPR